MFNTRDLLAKFTKYKIVIVKKYVERGLSKFTVRRQSHHFETSDQLVHRKQILPFNIVA